MPRIRHLTLAALVAAGCASETFDLLPTEIVAAGAGQGGAPGASGTAGLNREGGEGGEGGERGPSTGGVGGLGKAGGGGTGGRPPVGGSFGVGGSSAGMSGSAPKGGGGEAGDSQGCLGPGCPSSCQDDDDCLFAPYSKFRCHPDLWVCVECYERTQCGAGLACNPWTLTCARSCSDHEECFDSRWPVCELGVCVQCSVSEHCFYERPVCRASTCGPCRVSRQFGTDDCPAGKWCKEDAGLCFPDPPPDATPDPNP